VSAAEEAAGRPRSSTAARRLEALGLNQGTAGNVGLRIEGGLLVTPSAVPPAELEADDVVALDADGDGAARGRASRADQRVATARGGAGRSTGRRRRRPHPLAGGHRGGLPAPQHPGRPLRRRRTGRPAVPCAPYATYGSAELAANVVDALRDGGACLMANHGVLAVAPTLDRAVALAADVEWLARVHRLATAQGEPAVLSDGEIARVAERLRAYGQPPQPDS
jgi:L-fuculose-phosphate aldolase